MFWCKGNIFDLSFKMDYGDLGLIFGSIVFVMYWFNDFVGFIKDVINRIKKD